MILDLIPLVVAAKRLKISIATLRAWVREGKVPSYRLGKRFTRVSWEEVLASLSKDSQESASEEESNGD